MLVDKIRMCLAIPLKIKKIKKDKHAVAEAGGHIHDVYLGLLKNIKVGDYVIASHNMALNKISKDDAEKILKMIKE